MKSILVIVLIFIIPIKVLLANTESINTLKAKYEAQLEIMENITSEAALLAAELRLNELAQELLNSGVSEDELAQLTKELLSKIKSEVTDSKNNSDATNDLFILSQEIFNLKNDQLFDLLSKIGQKNSKVAGLILNIKINLLLEKQFQSTSGDYNSLFNRAALSLALAAELDGPIQTNFIDGFLKTLREAPVFFQKTVFEQFIKTCSLLSPNINEDFFVKVQKRWMILFPKDYLYVLKMIPKSFQFIKKSGMLLPYVVVSWMGGASLSTSLSLFDIHIPYYVSVPGAFLGIKLIFYSIIVNGDLKQSPKRHALKFIKNCAQALKKIRDSVE